MAEIIGKNIGPNGPVLNVGNPGNKGGTGRPKSEVRARCQGAFDERIKVAEAIADNPTSSDTDRLRALDLLGKYAGLQQVDNTSGDEPITDVNRDQRLAEIRDALRARAAGADCGSGTPASPDA